MLKNIQGYEDILEFSSPSESSRTIDTLKKAISVATEMSVRLIDVHDSDFPRCKRSMKDSGRGRKVIEKGFEM